MNMNTLFLSFLLGGMINSTVLSMDYNIVDSSLDTNRPTSFLGMIGLIPRPIKKRVSFVEIDQPSSISINTIAIGLSQPLISPTSVDAGIESPTTKIKGILKQSSYKK